MGKDGYRYYPSDLSDEWGMLPYGTRTPSDKAKAEFLQRFEDYQDGVGPKTTPYADILASQSHTDRMLSITHFVPVRNETRRIYEFVPADSLMLFHASGKIVRATVSHAIHGSYDTKGWFGGDSLSYTLTYKGDNQYPHGEQFLSGRIHKQDDSLEFAYTYSQDANDSASHLVESRLSKLSLKVAESAWTQTISHEAIRVLLLGMETAVSVGGLVYDLSIENGKVVIRVRKENTSMHHGIFQIPIAQPVEQIITDSGLQEFFEADDMRTVKPGDYNTWRIRPIEKLLGIEWDVRRKRVA